MGSVSAVTSWLPPMVLQSHSMSQRYVMTMLCTCSTILFVMQKLLQQNSWSVVNLDWPSTSAQATIFGNLKTISLCCVICCYS